MSAQAQDQVWAGEPPCFHNQSGSERGDGTAMGSAGDGGQGRWKRVHFQGGDGGTGAAVAADADGGDGGAAVPCSALLIVTEVVNFH